MRWSLPAEKWAALRYGWSQRKDIGRNEEVMRLRFERGRRDDLKTLHPACFAMVMATGIIAISAHLHAMPVVAALLFWLNALFLGGLLAATGARLLRYPRDVAADLRSHSRGVGFFTIVAALAVFGTQLDLQRGEARLAPLGRSRRSCGPS